MNPTPSAHNQALDWLKRLNEGEFAEVLHRFQMQNAYLPQKVSQVEQATLLIQHAENRNELDHLLNIIRQVAPQLARETPTQFSNPYKGLATFRAEDAKNKLFYGRENETHELLKLLAKQNFIALVGVSGSGKSSAVFAGLVPNLPAHWQVIECRPKDNAFKYLAKALLPLRVDETEREDQFLERLLKELPTGATKLPTLIEVWDSKQNLSGVPNRSLADAGVKLRFDTPKLILGEKPLQALKILLGVFLGLFVLVALAVFWLKSHGYNTYLAPPANNQSVVEQVILAEFQGQTAQLEVLALDETQYRGVKARYGSSATMTVIKAVSMEVGSEYFKTVLVPIVKSYPTHSKGILQARWIAKGSDDASGARWFGWMNDSWIFVFEANSKQTLDALVDAFPYISRQG